MSVMHITRKTVTRCAIQLDLGEKEDREKVIEAIGILKDYIPIDFSKVGYRIIVEYTIKEEDSK